MLFHMCGRRGQMCVPSGELGKYYILLVVLLVHRAAGARGTLGLGESVVILMLRAMDALLEDGLGLIDLKLRLEVVEMVGVTAAVGATASVGEAELFIDYLGSESTPEDGELQSRKMGVCLDGDVDEKQRMENLPVATTSAILLGLLGVNTIKAILGEELGKVLLGKDCALGQAGVVLLVVLVRSSHYQDNGCQHSDASLTLRWQEICRSLGRCSCHEPTTPRRRSVCREQHGIYFI